MEKTQILTTLIPLTVAPVVKVRDNSNKSLKL